MQGAAQNIFKKAEKIFLASGYLASFLSILSSSGTSYPRLPAQELSFPIGAVCGILPKFSLSAHCRKAPTRGDQRFADYDEVESLVFGKALVSGMPALAEVYEGEIVPSRAFAEGGIHEAIMEYENNVFFDILAEDLARRDMDDVPIDESNFAELTSRIDAYITEFEEHGTDNILVDAEGL